MADAVPYPKAVIFILGFEFCERFNFYGVRAVLSLFMNEYLRFSESKSLVMYHIFAMLIFLFPVVGAMIADSWLGKYKTVLYISFIYLVGNTLLTLSAIRPLKLPAKLFTGISLVLIAFGTGGMKPCISSFGGDQFALPEQEKQLEVFFRLFYFAINAGSFISMILTPIMRENVTCFGESSCYPFAFGIPTIIMIIGVVCLIMGGPSFTLRAPEGNMLIKSISCIGTAVKLKIKSKGVQKDHWLDFASETHGEKLVNEIKRVSRIFYLHIPLPFFWALFEQMPTAWTFQARRMTGEMGNFFTILPDQMQVANPIFCLILIPLFNYVIYPSCDKINILNKPLQKMVCGGIMCALAFAISGFLEISVESGFPDLPHTGNSQIRIFNILPCDISVTSEKLNNGNAISIPKLSSFTDKKLYFTDNATYAYTLTGDCSSAKGEFLVMEKTSASFFFKEKDKEPLYVNDDVDKYYTGYPTVRTVVNTNSVFDKPIDVEYLTSSKDVYRRLNSTDATLQVINPQLMNIKFGDSFTYNQKFSLGGVYMVGAIATAADKFDVKVLEVTKPNSVHILWMLPQYLVISIGEMMFSITGIEFAYSQAPANLKSVVQAIWLLTHAFGQIVVVILELLRFFEKQSVMFLFYSGLTLIDMCIFALMTLTYTYVEHVE